MKSWVEVVAQCKILPQTNAPLRSIPSIKHKEEAGASTLCAYKLTQPCPSLSLLAQFGLSSDLSAIRIHSLDILTCPFDSQSVVMSMESVSQAAELSKNRSCFLIRSTNQYFFIDGLNLLIFKVIIEQYLIIHIIQLVIFLADLITVIFFFSLLELGIFGCQC